VRKLLYPSSPDSRPYLHEDHEKFEQVLEEMTIETTLGSDFLEVEYWTAYDSQFTYFNQDTTLMNRAQKEKGVQPSNVEHHCYLKVGRSLALLGIINRISTDVDLYLAQRGNFCDISLTSKYSTGNYLL
jgi:hypothetical protein